MRKGIAVLAGVGIMAAVCAEPASARLRYGVRLGGDIAALRLTDADGYGMRNRSGFSGGLVLEYQFEKCGFAPDIAVLYTRRSAMLKMSGGDRSAFGRDFIEIPLHLKYKFWLKSTSDLVAPLVYAGPSLSIRVGDHGSGPMTTNILQPGLDVGIGFDVINFVQLTAGYRFGLGNACHNLTGCPGASLLTDSWNVSATILLDF